MAKIEMVRNYDGGEIYTVDGQRANCLATKTFYHTPDGEIFADIGYLDAIGKYHSFPNVCREYWEIVKDDDGDIDWSAYAKWADAYALEQLIEAPSYTYHEAVALGLIFHDPDIGEMIEEHAISPEDAPKVRALLDKIQPHITRTKDYHNAARLISILSNTR